MATNIVGATGIDKVQDGIIVNADIDTVAASKLTGALPAISAASLTNIPAANITGTLPAISGANLTGLSSFDPDGAVVFNESSADVDFRVESNDKSHMLFVDGGTNRVQIGSTGNPGVIFEVHGTVSAGASTDEVIQEWTIGSDNVKANIEYTDVSTSRGMNFGTSTQHDLILKTDDTTRMTIGYNGKVHIPGHVLQVISTTTTTKTTTSSTSYVDTAITASITPSKTSSKIMVFANILGITATSSLSAVSFGLFRDSTEIANNINYLYQVTDAMNAEYSMSKLDSPSSTSSLTYKIKFKNRQAAQIDVNTYNDDSTITLMEIGV